MDNNEFQSMKEAGWRYLEQFDEKAISYEMCKAAVEAYGAALLFVPDKYKTQEVSRIAVMNDKSALRVCIPEMYTPDFCIPIFKEIGIDAIMEIPKVYRTESLYAECVKEIPDIIRAIPKNARTEIVSRNALLGWGYESLAEAVKIDPAVLGLVHPNLYDHDSCLSFVQSEFFYNAVHTNPNSGYEVMITESGIVSIDEYSFALKKILKWYDVCAIAVTKSVLVLPYVPKKLKTAEICKLSVMADAVSLHAVPDNLRTKELCMIAFNQDPSSIHLIPEKYIDRDMCEQAINHSTQTFAYIPNQFKTVEMCKKAIRNSPTAFQFIPDSLMSEELALFAIQSGVLISKIPEQFRTYEVCMMAVCQEGGDLRYVPAHHRDYDMCLNAAQNSRGGILRYVPEKYLTEELLCAAMQGRAMDFQIIPKDRLTWRVCLEAVKNCHEPEYPIADIPPELLNEELCLESVKAEPRSLSAIPENMITEEMVLIAAQSIAALAKYTPERMKSQEFISKVIEINPRAENYL